MVELEKRREQALQVLTAPPPECFTQQHGDSAKSLLETCFVLGGSCHWVHILRPRSGLEKRMWLDTQGEYLSLHSRREDRLAQGLGLAFPMSSHSVTKSQNLRLEPYLIDLTKVFL